MAEDELLDPFDPKDIGRASTVIIERQQESDDRLVALLRARTEAYKRVFMAASPSDRKLVLDDLQRFCRGDTAAWHEDARLHALLVGRQEVYYRVTDHINLTVDELLEKYHERQ